MADELDRLIRAAMKTLDDEVPSGYFEALPNRTIARLEGSSMQHGSSGTTQTRDTVVSPPPMAIDDNQPSTHDAQEREDSGLHDIRNLAQSTKQRLSSRRISAPSLEEDVLASSSGSFKNIALPQPAKMVSLPELEDLPSQAEVAAAEKAAKKAAKAKKSEQLAASAAVEAPAAASARQAFSLPSQQKKSKAPWIALVGTGLAAAAGAVIYMQVNKSADRAAAPASTGAVAVAPAAQPAEPPPAPAAAAAPVVTPIEEPDAAAADVPVATGAAQTAADAPKAEAPSEETKAEKKSARKAKADKGDDDQPEKAAKPDKREPKKAEPAVKANAEDNEPSFEQLLKEAGVVERKETKPKLDKKSLTGADFKSGMAGPTAKAKGCYRGNQGTAMIKLTVDPSGKVSKVAVTGQFAGTPEAACVESAIREATFPPWDGGPQSFTYTVLLSD